MGDSTAAQQILGVLFKQKTPKGQDKKRAVKPKANRTTKGEKSVTAPKQQNGETAGDAVPMGLPKPPTDRQVVKQSARSAKVRATQDWIDGRMDSKAHDAVHKRANHVLSGKDPGGFKGRTGERAPKGRLAW